MPMMKYDEAFEPPAPIAKVALRKIETGARTKDVSLLLDTGSDISLLPLSAVKSLKIEPLRERKFLA